MWRCAPLRGPFGRNYRVTRRITRREIDCQAMRAQDAFELRTDALDRRARPRVARIGMEVTERVTPGFEGRVRASRPWLRYLRACESRTALATCNRSRRCRRRGAAVAAGHAQRARSKNRVDPITASSLWRTIANGTAWPLCASASACSTYCRIAASPCGTKLIAYRPESSRLASPTARYGGV